VVTAAALALALVAGCSSGGGAAAPSSVEKPDLNVAVVPALDSAGFFVALYQGLFKAHGLNVHFIPATSSETVIANQVKGVDDITGGNYVSYIQAQHSREANLDIFAEGSVMEPGAQGIYTMPNSPIRSLADLKDHTIAINAPKNILYLLASSVLAEHGISPASVEFTSVPFPEMATELKSGAVSAAVMPEPFSSGAEQAEGGIPLADLNQGATTSFPVEGYVVTKQLGGEVPAYAGGVLQGARRGAADRGYQPRRGPSRDGGRAGPVRRVQGNRGGHGPGQLSGQHGTGRQRG